MGSHFCSVAQALGLKLRSSVLAVSTVTYGVINSPLLFYFIILFLPYQTGKYCSHFKGRKTETPSSSAITTLCPRYYALLDFPAFCVPDPEWQSEGRTHVDNLGECTLAQCIRMLCPCQLWLRQWKGEEEEAPLLVSGSMPSLLMGEVLETSEVHPSLCGMDNGLEIKLFLGVSSSIKSNYMNLDVQKCTYFTM